MKWQSLTDHFYFLSRALWRSDKARALRYLKAATYLRLKHFVPEVA